MAVVRSLWLAAGVTVLWLLLAGPAYWLAGTAGVEGLSIAALLCLLPGWLVFALGTLYGVANNQAATVLSGTVLRLLFVLFGALAVRNLRPDLQFREFFVWLLVFYMATLLLETLLTAGKTSEG